MSNREGLLAGLVTVAVLCVLCFIWYSIGRDDGSRPAYVRGYAAAVDSVKAASRVAPDSAWFTGHGADFDTVIVWGWHR